jgi:microcin C transport system substrate-binding protein
LNSKFLRRAGAAIALIAASLVLTAQAPQAPAPEEAWRHGLSLFGKLKYPPGFKQFDYVRADAPKGGTVRLGGFGTFDNFNVVISGLKGTQAMGVNLIYDTLMTNSLDEVSTGYGLIAESVSHPDDFSSVTYRLRPEAKWHDGEPITADDVIFSFEAFKTNNPLYSSYYQHVTKLEKSGDHEVTFTFDAPGNREMPMIVGELFVLPKHWYEGVDKSGNKRNIGATSLEPPLGSGPYRIKEFQAGRSIVYERVKNYWGKDLPVRVGTNNFDEIRYEYYRDTLVSLEAFKADRIDYRSENSAKNWATAYDFPAVQDKRVVLEEFPIRISGVMQAFVLNTRREKFADPRVRLAFNYALDFEEMNKQMFFGMYSRIGSYFEGTELASSGLPTGRELEILETVRNEVPPEVFTTEYKPPVNGNPDAVRNNLRTATRLLRQAGWEIRDQKLVNTKTGEPMTVEILNIATSPDFERLFLFYKPSLERLGVTVSVRSVDEAQYINRERNFDFDMVVSSWRQSLTPGNEQREYWGSKSADTMGSRNLIGIKNPAVDKLIERIVFAKDRDEVVAATHALDRVLLWNQYVVPQWTYPRVRTARWNRFAHPEKLPEYGLGAFPTIWWWDPALAAKAGGRQ